MKRNSLVLNVTVLVMLGLSAACSGDDESSWDSEPEYTLQQVVEYQMDVSSGSLDAKGNLPRSFTCEGEDTSPHLGWSGVPEATKSLVVIMDDPKSDIATKEDPDTGKEIPTHWTHWILFAIPPEVTEIHEGEAAQEVLASGAKHGTSDFGNTHYRGPCPTPTIMVSNNVNLTFTKPVVAKLRPYFFTVYALDIELEFDAGASRNTVLSEIDGHILAAGLLAPEYRSSKKITRSGTGSAAN